MSDLRSITGHAGLRFLIVIPTMMTLALCNCITACSAKEPPLKYDLDFYTDGIMTYNEVNGLVSFDNYVAKTGHATDSQFHWLMTALVTSPPKPNWWTVMRRRQILLGDVEAVRSFSSTQCKALHPILLQLLTDRWAGFDATILLGRTGTKKDIPYLKPFLDNSNQLDPIEPVEASKAITRIESRGL